MAIKFSSTVCQQSGSQLVHRNECTIVRMWVAVTMMAGSREEVLFGCGNAISSISFVGFDLFESSFDKYWNEAYYLFNN